MKRGKRYVLNDMKVRAEESYIPSTQCTFRMILNNYIYQIFIISILSYIVNGLRIRYGTGTNRINPRGSSSASLFLNSCSANYFSTKVLYIHNLILLFCYPFFRCLPSNSLLMMSPGRKGLPWTLFHILYWECPQDGLLLL